MFQTLGYYGFFIGFGLLIFAIITGVVDGLITDARREYVDVDPADVVQAQEDAEDA